MATRHTYGGSQQHFNGNLGQEEAEGVMGQVRAAGEAVGSQAKEVIEEYPLSTVLAVFGIGLGVGVVLGSAMFCERESSSWSSSNWFPSGSSSNWFPSMSSNTSSWLPSGSSNSWFGNNSNASNWGENLVKGTKSMCGY